MTDDKAAMKEKIVRLYVYDASFRQLRSFHCIGWYSHASCICQLLHALVAPSAYDISLSLATVYPPHRALTVGRLIGLGRMPMIRCEVFVHECTSDQRDG